MQNIAFAVRFCSGPYSKGEATERSDVDLLVDIGLRGLAFFGLMDGVVFALDVPVDMIDVSQVEQGSLVELEIKRSGVQIYGQYLVRKG